MSVSHEAIMAEIIAMKKLMATKADVERLEEKVAAVEVKQDQTKEIVETFAAFKTGGRFIAWMSKFTAGAIAIWVLIQGGAEFIVELGKK